MTVQLDDWTLSSLSGAMDWAVVLPPGASVTSGTAGPRSQLTSSIMERVHSYPALYTELTPTLLTGSESAAPAGVPTVYARLSSIVRVEKVGPRQLRLCQQLGWPASYRLIVLTASSEAACDDWWRALHRLTSGNTQDDGSGMDAATPMSSPTPLPPPQQQQQQFQHSGASGLGGDGMAELWEGGTSGTHDASVVELRQALFSPSSQPALPTPVRRPSLRLVAPPPPPPPPPPHDALTRQELSPPEASQQAGEKTPSALPERAEVQPVRRSLPPPPPPSSPSLSASSLSASTIGPSASVSARPLAATIPPGREDDTHDDHRRRRQPRRRAHHSGYASDSGSSTPPLPPPLVVRRATRSDATQTPPLASSRRASAGVVVAPALHTLVSEEPRDEAGREGKGWPTRDHEGGGPPVLEGAALHDATMRPPAEAAASLPAAAPLATASLDGRSPTAEHREEESIGHGGPDVSAWRSSRVLVPAAPFSPLSHLSSAAPTQDPLLYEPIRVDTTPVPRARSASSLLPPPLSAAAGVLGWRGTSQPPSWSPRITYGGAAASHSGRHRTGTRSRSRASRHRSPSPSSLAPARHRSSSGRATTARPASSKPQRSRSASPPVAVGSNPYGVPPLLAVIAKPHLFLKYPVQQRQQQQQTTRGRSGSKHSSTDDAGGVATYVFVTTDEDCVVAVPSTRFRECVEEAKLLQERGLPHRRSSGPAAKAAASSLSIAVRSFERAKHFFGEDHCRAMRVAEVDRVTRGNEEPLILLNSVQRERFRDPSRLVCIVSQTHAFVLEATNSTEAEWYVRSWKKYLHRRPRPRRKSRH